ncbi:MAG: hypothetical protein JWQ58_1921, partial [Reyranella sp.]|nr:hypothetical protein [Reyranella sp.]
ALHRRRTTGEGCHIDVAQAEAGIQFLAPAWYQYAANGTVPERRGHAGSPLKAPHGIFRCAGKDRWIAIDASADAAWQALRAVVGTPLLDATFDTLIGRLRHRDDLEAAITGWTAAQDAEGLERSLQAAGVPAHVVSNSGDLARDRELTGGHYRKIDDPVVGEATIEGPRYRLGRTPERETRRGPRIGEHTIEVLRDLCRYDEVTIAELKDAGVLV